MRRLMILSVWFATACAPNVGRELFSCTSDADCVAGRSCKGGFCRGRAADGTCLPTTCALEGRRCGPLSDGCGGTLECGGCESPTGGTATCDNGVCRSSCGAGKVACNGQCVTESAMACGSSCQVCPPPQGLDGGARCVAGQCETFCEAGFAKCQVGSTTVCRAQSPMSCGESCQSCPAPDGGVASCVSGRCEQSCLQGALPCNGQCVSCATPTGGAVSCGMSGSCVQLCTGPARLCSGGSLRCEVESASSCGASCEVCPVPDGGTASCGPGGTCAQSCSGPARLCGSGAAARCEAESATSCGPACVTCPAIPNATPVCVSGSCGSICTSDAQCVARGGGLARCDATGTCRACLPTNDNCPASQRCDPASLVCVPGCKGQTSERTDCPLETICVNNACVLGCRSNTDCITTAAVNQTCCTPGTACGPATPSATGVCFAPRWFKRPIPAGQLPPPRADGTMAFDSVRGVVVVYGGVGDGGVLFNDLWEYDGGGGWVNRQAPRPDAGLRYPSMVFDPVRRLSVLYGGTDSSGAFPTQASHWNGVTWAAPPAEGGALGMGPGRRIQFPLLYDSARQRTVLLYGTGGNNPATDANGDVCVSMGVGVGSCRDMWSLSPTGWMSLSVVGSTYPSTTLFQSSVVFDSVRDAYVLFRSESSGNETWVFTPTTNSWSRLLASQASPVRQKALLVYDSRRERTLLIGGASFAETSLDLDVWSLRSAESAWALENTPTPALRPEPPPVTLPLVVYDSVHGRVVLLGGQKVNSGSVSEWTNDTWVYGGP